MHRPLNFWKSMPKPILALAPMEDVTDTAFRELVLRISTPGLLHVLFTEFTSTDGLCHPIGRDKVSHRLHLSHSERALLQKHGAKIVAQIWGNKPEKFYQAIRILNQEYDFDGIDINMGCPVRNVVAHGSCSALIDQETLAGEIIHAARQATPLPLSVKTRLGVKTIDTERWMTFLLQQPLEAIILHGRIQKQMSEGEANWQEIARAAALRNQLAPNMALLGNGDVLSLEQAFAHSQSFGTDGVMIGRGIFKNPWLFNSTPVLPSESQRLEALQLHLHLFEQSWGSKKNFAILRRFFKIYLQGFAGAAELRSSLMETKDYHAARTILNDYQGRQYTAKPPCMAGISP